MKFIWLIQVLVLSGNIQRVISNDIYVKNVNTWETVILPCQLTPSVITMRWRRGNEYLFQGLQVNLNASRNNRYAILGNQRDWKYNLQITNVTQEDIGTYMCDLQLPNNIARTKYLLTVKEPKSVAVQSSGWTNESFVTDTTISYSARMDKEQSNESSRITTEVIDKVSEKRTSTESSRDDSEKQVLSSREMLYYGLLAAGLILVLFVSTMCNACVNRKCSMAIPRTTDDIANDNITDKEEDNKENLKITERNDVTSLYETINENDMLPDSSIALQWRTQNVASMHNNNAPIVLSVTPISRINCLDVNNLDQPNHFLHTKLELSVATNIIGDSLHHVKRRNSLSESKRLSEESVDITGSKDDGYLHPYVALNTNEIECLHSYSTPNLASVKISSISDNSPGPAADNEHYYTDGLSVKEVST